MKSCRCGPKLNPCEQKFESSGECCVVESSPPHISSPARHPSPPHPNTHALR